MQWMLYKIPPKRRDLFVVNPEMHFVEEFKRLSVSKMLFVILVADAFSPLTYLLVEQGELAMRQEAARRCKWESSTGKLTTKAKKIIHGEDLEIEEAIKVYRVIQPGSSNLTMLRMVETLIHKYLEKNQDDKLNISAAQMRIFFNIVDKGVLSKLAEESTKIYRHFADLNNMKRENKKRNEAQATGNGQSVTGEENTDTDTQDLLSESETPIVSFNPDEDD